MERTTATLAHSLTRLSTILAPESAMKLPQIESQQSEKLIGRKYSPFEEKTDLPID
jgi:hypothetical protein